VRGPVDHRFVRSIYFRDPNGYVIELTATPVSTVRSWIQRIFDRVDSMITERYVIELWRNVREESLKDLGD
jgi:catechol-2,3-dioxygenase